MERVFVPSVGAFAERVRALFAHCINTGEEIANERRNGQEGRRLGCLRVGGGVCARSALGRTPRQIRIVFRRAAAGLDAERGG